MSVISTRVAGIHTADELKSDIKALNDIPILQCLERLWVYIVIRNYTQWDMSMYNTPNIAGGTYALGLKPPTTISSFGISMFVPTGSSEIEGNLSYIIEPPNGSPFLVTLAWKCVGDVYKAGVGEGTDIPPVDAFGTPLSSSKNIYLGINSHNADTAFQYSFELGVSDGNKQEFVLDIVERLV